MFTRLCLLALVVVLPLNGVHAKKKSDEISKRKLIPRKPELKVVKNLQKCGKDTCEPLDAVALCSQAIPMALNEFYSRYVSEPTFGGIYHDLEEPLVNYAQNELNRLAELNKPVKQRKKWQFWKKKKKSLEELDESEEELEAPEEPKSALCKLKKYSEKLVVFSPVPENIKCTANKKKGSAKVKIILSKKERDPSYFRMMDANTHPTVDGKGKITNTYHAESGSVKTTLEGSNGGGYFGPYCSYVVNNAGTGLRFDCYGDAKIKKGWYQVNGKNVPNLLSTFEIAQTAENCAEEKVTHLTGTNKTTDIKAGAAAPEAPKKDPHDAAIPKAVDGK
jgi:hypothetical protein